MSVLTPRVDARTAWTDESMFAFSLVTLFIDNYGMDAAAGREAWSPETVALEIQDDFSVQLPPTNLSKLMGAITLLRTNDFYWSVPDFNMLCNILSGDLFSVSPEIATPIEVAWGITEAMLLDPPDDAEPFTREIRAFIGGILDNAGIINAPDILRIAIRDRAFHAERIQAEYTDDPDMFASIYAIETEKTEEINSEVRARLSRLIDQIGRLPLRFGNTADSHKMLLAALGQQAAA